MKKIYSSKSKKSNDNAQNKWKKIGKEIALNHFMTNSEEHIFSQQYENKKSALIESVEHKTHMKPRKWKAIAAAAIVALAVPVTGFAAKVIIDGIKESKNQTANYEYQYIFEKGEAGENYHAPVYMEVNYLPEGFIENKSKKYSYSYEGKINNRGVTIELLGFNEDSDLRVNNAVALKELQIGDKRAALYTLNVSDDSGFDKNLFIFYQEFGYGVRLYGQMGVSEDELVKIAEGVSLTPCDAAAATDVYYIPDTAIAEAHKNKLLEVAEERKNSKPKEADDSNYFSIGDTFEGIDMGTWTSDDKNPKFLQFKVEGYEIFDSIAGLDKDKLDQDINEIINEDGTFKIYEKQNIKEGDRINTVSEVTSVEEKELKLVYVTMKVANNTENDISEVQIDPIMCCLDNENGSIKMPEIYTTNAVNSEGWAVYCDMPTMYEKNPSAYENAHHYGQVYSLQANQEVTYHVAYVVEADRVDNMVLFFPKEGNLIDSNSQNSRVVKLYN